MRRFSLADTAVRAESHRAVALQYANDRLLTSLAAVPNSSLDDTWDAAVEAAFAAKRQFDVSLLVKRTADGGVAIR